MKLILILIIHIMTIYQKWASTGSESKASACNEGDPGSVLESEDLLEKEMATRSSTLAWKIPWTEEPGGLQSMGSQRVVHDWATSLASLLKISFPITATSMFINTSRSSWEANLPVPQTAENWEAPTTSSSYLDHQRNLSVARLTLGVTRWEVSNCALNNRLTRIAFQAIYFPY